MDRISGLPSDVIHHIMSYLSAKQIAQMSILCKRWNDLRISFPIFDFKQSEFVTVFVENRLALHDRLKEFLEFIDASLLRFHRLKFLMDKFRLSISLLDVEESAPYIAKWIGLAIEMGVKEFELELLTNKDTVYTLPRTIFSATSVATLFLFRCKLKKIPDTIRLNSLKKLSLERVFTNEGTLQKLCSECPLLEELFLLHCCGWKRLCVSEALKLKIMAVSFEQIERVEIVVPNLQELALEIAEWGMAQVFIGCSHLKKLKFSSSTMKDKQFHHFISSFPSLEDLILDSCKSFVRITISSNQLKNFRLSNCRYMKALDLDTPNLLSFAYEDSPVPTTCITTFCTWQVKFSSNFTFDTRWCLKLREFLRLSSQTETLDISTTRPNVHYFKVEEFRKSYPSFPCNVGNLKLNTELPASESWILLEGLLGICCPETLHLQTHPHVDQHELFESFYNELKNRDASCCSSHDIKCWRNYLKDFKVESFKDVNSRKLIEADNLMKLLSTNNLSDRWPMLPSGIIKIQLDWSLPNEH